MKIYFLAALAATRQPQQVCAGLSTSKWTASTGRKLCPAAKITLWSNGVMTGG